MEIHFPSPNHIEQMKELWSICFGDNKDYIDFYYKNCYKNKNTIIAIEDDKVVAMMTFLPALLNTNSHIYKGSYVYAVATHPDYRKRGYMQKLDYALGAVAEFKGDKFLCLVPSSEELFAVYEKLGYKTATHIGEKTYYVDQVTEQNAITMVKSLNEKHFIPSREHYMAHIHQSIRLDGYYLDYWYKELCEVGCKTLYVQNKFGQGYLVYYYDKTDKNAIIVREAGLSKTCFKTAIKEIGSVLNVNKIVINAHTKFDTDMKIKPYGMIKFLDSKLKKETKEEIYMNLMLD